MIDKSGIVVSPMLTDYYQLTMAFTYWKSNKVNDNAVFEMFFRKNPFKGEFTIFAGLRECIDYISSFKFTNDDIAYFKQILPVSEDTFFDYLLNMDAKCLSLWSVPEGCTVFPKVPIMRVEGPIIVCQFIESALLNLVNFASLIATNAMRYRLAAGPDRKLFEFGLRRAQGPNGALSASHYAYLGGFDGTSNILAGGMYGIPVVGTHAHSFICSFQAASTQTNSVNENDTIALLSDAHHPVDSMNHTSFDSSTATRTTTGEPIKLDEFVRRCKYWSKQLAKVLTYAIDQTQCAELIAFANYAAAFPKQFVALLDTYDVLGSGLPNFCAVALALNEYGYLAKGVRIDSGDLAYLSSMVRQGFQRISKHYDLPWFEKILIFVSNDLNEETVRSLNEQCHSIDAFCVGTNLVTCQSQPALGCVYKLVEINAIPTMKLSADMEKLTLPGKKSVYRLYGTQGEPILDLLQRPHEPVPKVHSRIMCRHPTDATKRVFVIPSEVEDLLRLYVKNGQLVTDLPTLNETREFAKSAVDKLRPDYKRLLNPTPYKISVSEEMYDFTRDLWLKVTPVGELY